ncbi:hypothetical protein EVAR_81991_1 [Eumeta japonica]|uniref:Uncharacterized protein n=1 Tax=Eumeta variegata TaxID=151549 RepID=A0A4C1VUV8_EUMVA|nr:hypothetical protein EVAR_81991_1 [Eumeta japonica]
MLRKGRLNTGNKTNGIMLAILNSKSASRQAHLAIHNGVLIPTLMYGSENWVYQKKNGSKINAVEMLSLRNMCEVCLNGRCRNSDVEKQYGLKEDVVT